MGLFANIANGWKLFSKLHLRCFTGYWKASAVYRFKTDKILTVTEFTQIHWKYTLKVLKSTLRKIMLQTLNIATSIFRAENIDRFSNWSETNVWPNSFTLVWNRNLHCAMKFETSQSSKWINYSAEKVLFVVRNSISHLICCFCLK